MIVAAALPLLHLMYKLVWFITAISYAIDLKKRYVNSVVGTYLRQKRDNGNVLVGRQLSGKFTRFERLVNHAKLRPTVAAMIKAIRLAAFLMMEYKVQALTNIVFLGSLARLLTASALLGPVGTLLRPVLELANSTSMVCKILLNSYVSSKFIVPLTGYVDRLEEGIRKATLPSAHRKSFWQTTAAFQASNTAETNSKAIPEMQLKSTTRRKPKHPPKPKQPRTRRRSKKNLHQQKNVPSPEKNNTTVKTSGNASEPGTNAATGSV